jgi:hypothetical protein
MVVTDEEQPLLRIISQDPGSNVKHDSIPDFDLLGPEDPKNWNPAFKWFIVLLLALMAFTV